MAQILLLEVTATMQADKAKELQELKNRVSLSIAAYNASCSPFVVETKDVQKVTERLSRIETPLFETKGSETVDGVIRIPLYWSEFTKFGEPVSNLLGCLWKVDMAVVNKPAIVLVNVGDYHAVLANEYEAFVPYYILPMMRDALHWTNL